MWGGRFQMETDALVRTFNASIEFDRELALEDIEGSVAHARMLAEQGILGDDEAALILEGLDGIRADIAAGRLRMAGELRRRSHEHRAGADR